MMEQFFKFTRLPFERDIPTGQLYTTPKFDELLSRLEQALGKSLQIKPEMAASMLTDAVVEVEAVDVRGHFLARKRGGHVATSPRGLVC